MGTGANFVRAVLQIKRSVNGPLNGCLHERTLPGRDKGGMILMYWNTVRFLHYFPIEKDYSIIVNKSLCKQE